MRRVRDAGGQAVLTIDGSLPSRMSGPPLHVHFLQREEIVVKAGSLGARVGNEKIVVPAGGTGVFPAGVVHTWWNAGDDLLELSGRAIPAADLDRFLQALLAVLNASPSGRPSIFYIAHVLWRHRPRSRSGPPPSRRSLHAAGNHAELAGRRHLPAASRRQSQRPAAAVAHGAPPDRCAVPRGNATSSRRLGCRC